MKKFAFLLLFVILFSCKKDEEPYYDDESIEVTVCLGLSVYKTKGDYFKFISRDFNLDSTCVSLPWFYSSDQRIKIENGDTTYTYRFHLKNGFILSKEVDHTDYFTNITYPEYLAYQNKTNETFSSKMFWDRVIDKDPFTEYYLMTTLDCRVKFTLGEINQMIEDGTLTQKFTKYK